MAEVDSVQDAAFSAEIGCVFADCDAPGLGGVFRREEFIPPDDFGIQAISDVQDLQRTVGDGDLESLWLFQPHEPWNDFRPHLARHFHRP